MLEMSRRRNRRKTNQGRKKALRRRLYFAPSRGLLEISRAENGREHHRLGPPARRSGAIAGSFKTDPQTIRRGSCLSRRQRHENRKDSGRGNRPGPGVGQKNVFSARRRCAGGCRKIGRPGAQHGNAGMAPERKARTDCPRDFISVRFPGRTARHVEYKSPARRFVHEISLSKGVRNDFKRGKKEGTRARKIFETDFEHHGGGAAKRKYKKLSNKLPREAHLFHLE